MIFYTDMKYSKKHDPLKLVELSISNVTSTSILGLRELLGLIRYWACRILNLEGKDLDSSSLIK